MNHTLLKITIWRKSRKTKINSISFHHIALVEIFQQAKNFVILILYEKVMPILMKMPKNFSSTKFRIFLQELRNTKERLDWWTNEMFDILFI